MPPARRQLSTRSGGGGGGSSRAAARALWAARSSSSVAGVPSFLSGGSATGDGLATHHEANVKAAGSVFAAETPELDLGYRSPRERQK